MSAAARIIVGDVRDVLATLDACSVQCCVTSPPYWNLRNYNVEGQIGLEATRSDYVATLVEVFRGVRRVLRDDGTVFLNLGDSYVDKQLQMIPARVALALQDDGWILRSEIVWSKPNPMPESVQGSHVFRHRVTIADYERLSGLQYTSKCGDQNGSGDLPCVSSGESVGGEAALPAEREGSSDDARAGTARGREGKAPRSEPISTRENEQSQVRANGKGQADQGDCDGQVQSERIWQAAQRRTLSGNERFSHSYSAEGAGERTLQPHGQDEGEEASGLCPASGSNRSDTSGDGGGLDAHRGATQAPLLLLREADRVDGGSCHPAEQGRVACEREPRPGVPELQLEEARQNNPSLLVDCPGCPKCAPHGGYIHVLGAGRPTVAHEHIWLLTKAARYFYDADAIRETSQANAESRKRAEYGRYDAGTGTAKRDSRTGKPDYFQVVGNDQGGGDRNARTVWDIATSGFSEAHFATFPLEIPRRCILAGTSERGACPSCGAPWKRVVERIPTGRIQKMADGWDTGAGGHGTVHRNGREHGSAGVAVMANATTGWQPTCRCDDAREPVPCVVLDPFSGAGTTGVVALRHGRDYIGIELNSDYAAMSERRIRGDAPLLNRVELSAA